MLHQVLQNERHHLRALAHDPPIETIVKHFVEVRTGGRFGDPSVFENCKDGGQRDLIWISLLAAAGTMRTFYLPVGDSIETGPEGTDFPTLRSLGRYPRRRCLQKRHHAPSSMNTNMVESDRSTNWRSESALTIARSIARRNLPRSSSSRLTNRHRNALRSSSRYSSLRVWVAMNPPMTDGSVLPNTGRRSVRTLASANTAECSWVKPAPRARRCRPSLPRAADNRARRVDRSDSLRDSKSMATIASTTSASVQSEPSTMPDAANRAEPTLSLSPSTPPSTAWTWRRNSLMEESGARSSSMNLSADSSERRAKVCKPVTCCGGTLKFGPATLPIPSSSRVSKASPLSWRSISNNVSVVHLSVIGVDFLRIGLGVHTFGSRPISCTRLRPQVSRVYAAIASPATTKPAAASMSG